MSVIGVVRRSLGSRARLAVSVMTLVIAAAQVGATPAYAATRPNGAATAATSASAGTPKPLKAVFIVGPTNALTSSNLTNASALADVAQSLGMDVRRVFFPHATWANVLANIQGANLVVYMGHGYGWPSPYTTTLTESRQDGLGLNSFDGSSASQYTYYGANLLKQYVTLAPNAIVFLNHLCYSAGNGEPGMAYPTWDVARQRVDNMASGWLATGARTVFAYGEQAFTKSLKALFSATANYSMEDVFRFPGTKPTEVYGWVGSDPRKFDSVRTPGATNFLDPDPTGDGWYRAVTGDLTMTASDWRLGPNPNSGAPAMSNVQTSSDGAATLVGASGTLFTPNGDGSTDTLTLSYTTNKETFVDWQVEDADKNVVRSFSSWTAGGSSSASWDGAADNGSYVPDGKYTLTGTPSSRQGEVGSSVSTSATVLTAMSSASVSRALFYAADGDSLAPTTTFSMTLTQPAVFSWRVVDATGNVVRTNMANASLDAGNVSWTWDGRNDASAFVPDGTYYSVTTATTPAGTYSQRLGVDVEAFRLLTATPPPFVRGTKVKVTVYSAETLSSLTPKPKVRVTLPGLAATTYATTKQADGGFYVTVKFPTTAQAGTAQVRVQGTDANGAVQYTDYSFPLK